VLEERETRAAKRYSAAELEKMALESENEAARMRGDPPPHKSKDGDGEDDVSIERRAQQKGQLLAAAQSLLQTGVDPKIVGQILMGLPISPGQPQIVAGPQGMTMQDVLAIVTLITENRSDDSIKDIVRDLKDEIKDVRAELKAKNSERVVERIPVMDPLVAANQHFKVLKQTIDSVRELGMPGFGIAPVATAAPVGESIEALKERNRHEEAMGKQKSDAKYHEGLVEVAASIPERIGAGLAGAAMERHAEDVPPDSNLEKIQCECGNTIIAPKAIARVKCPRCGLIYEKKPSIMQQQPPPQARQQQPSPAQSPVDEISEASQLRQDVTEEDALAGLGR